MSAPVSKSEFKAHALEILREVEQTGQPRIITDRGKPVIEIRKLRTENTSPLQALKGSVIKYVDPTLPVGDDDWNEA